MRNNNIFVFDKGYYTHSNFKDVFIEVVSIKRVYKDKTELNVRWWNKGQMGVPYLITKNPEGITVFQDQYNNWSKYE